MESINLRKPTKQGLNAINEALFNFDGLPFWLIYTGQNFVEMFWERKSILKEYAKTKELKYNLICNGHKVPFIYNSLIF